MEENKRMKIKVYFLVILVFVILYGCTPKIGEPDKLGSWGQINQNVTRGADWQQIVTDSMFQLGEKSVKGSWNTPDGTQDYYEIKYGTYPSIDGSTVAVPMAVEFARQHLNFSDEDANDFAAFSTTHAAYENLLLAKANTAAIIRSGVSFLDENHPVDLIIVTEPSADELEMAAQNNITLIKEPVCYDAFVFITHKDNPVNSITVEQIKDIYSGKITNWNDIGGEDMPITAYQREENSGSQTAMLNLVMKDTPMLPPETVKIVWEMGSLIDAVAEYENNSTSIGYTYKYYVDTLYKNENIKVLEVDGISSEESNLRTNLYPFTTCYYGIIKSNDHNSTGYQFLNWMLSREGQQCIKQAGYIPYLEY